MTETKESYSSIKVITFSGKKKDWDAWEEKFLAKARRRGYKRILLGEDEIPNDSVELDPEEEADKEQLLIREMNMLAYEELVLSIDDNESAGKVAFKIVKKSKTAENADGDAHLAWTGLKRKYAPTTAPTLANLHKQFYKAKLKKNCLLYTSPSPRD